MKKLLAVFVSAAFFLVPLNAIAAVKAGASCSKLGATSTYAGKKYTCIKSGKKLVWNKGVAVAAPKPTSTPTPTPSPSPTPTATETATPTPAPTPSPTSSPFIEGGNCEKMGKQGNDSTGILECRKIVGNKLIYVRITNKFDPVVNPVSPDSLKVCQLPDMRTEKKFWRPSIAYPPIPEAGFTATGTFKVVVVGIDFSDSPGDGSPSDIWREDLIKATEWLNWYTNGKVKYNFTTNNKWLRAPRTSEKYDQANEADKSAGGNTVGLGGMTDTQQSEDFVNLISETTDLSNTTAIWIYYPPTIQKITEQWYNRDVHVQNAKYGLVKAMMAAIGADTYTSKRVRWGYFLHEMMHSHGIFGHSPKIPWRIGLMSTGAGFTNALLTWDALSVGWVNESDIYCVDKQKLSPTDIKIVPLGREQSGVRAISVKLNDHQALIVESLRKDKWSYGLGQGFAGVMVTLVDTTISTTWDNPEGMANPSSVSRFLKVEGANHGGYESVGTGIPLGKDNINWDIGVVDGIGIAGDKDPWDLNYVMYVGESIIFDGVKISLLIGGDNDTIRIEKTS